ncbi:MAG: hypothetical protein Kow00114_36090 [Kiloniellaceae bacterium]
MPRIAAPARPSAMHPAIDGDLAFCCPDCGKPGRIAEPRPGLVEEGFCERCNTELRVTVSRDGLTIAVLDAPTGKLLLPHKL